MHYLYDKLLALDNLLVTKGGFPPLSEFWRNAFRELLTGNGGSRRRLVARCGRQGGKSTNSMRLFAILGVYGQFHITPGTVGTIAIVAQNREQATERLRTLAAILDVMRVKYTKTKTVISLIGRPIEYHVFSATIGGVSGMQCIGFCADELSKWKSPDSLSNPADEVLASLRPTMATHEGALSVLISSPLGNDDAHYAAMAEGTNDIQYCCQAPSWIANPSITEARTHELEPDLRRWRREFKAEPQLSELNAFDADAIERCFVERPECHTKAQRVLVIDASSGKKDRFTWGLAGYELGEDPYLHEQGNPDLPYRRHRVTRELLLKPGVQKVAPVLRFDEVGCIGDGSFWESKTGDQALDEIVQIARQNGVRHVHGDQREEMMIRSGIERRGLRFSAHTYSNPSKEKAVTNIRRWLQESTLQLPPEATTLKTELYQFEEKISSSGNLTFGGRGKHDDYVSLLLTAAMADEAGELPDSPYKKKRSFVGIIRRPFLSF